MVGRDLTLLLAVSATSPPQGSGVADILDRMQLTYLDELVLPLENGALWKTKSSDPAKPLRLANARSATPVPAMIKVRCGGRVDYDFAIDQLSLRNSISFIHHVPGGIEDRFDCEAIDLNLRNPSDTSLPRTTPLEWISRLTATGSPAVLKMPSFEFDLKAERIDIDALAGLIKADGRRGVEIRRGPVSARLTQLAYQFDPQRPKSLGAIDAFGTGIVTLADNEMALKEVRWLKGFTLQPSDEAEIGALNSDLEVFLDGSVEAKFADGGMFTANEIAGVLKPVKKPSPKKKSNAISFMPDRIQAKGDVRIDTAAIAAETETLLLYFDDDPDPAPESIDQADNHAGSAIRQWTVQPGQTDGTVDPVARPRPVIRGNLVSAQLRMNDSGLQAKDLSVIGAVELDHMVLAGGQMLPAKLRGEELQLNTDAGRDVLKLGSGAEAPARFEIGDGFFVGPMILVWPTENLVQIQGAGEFQMPTAVLPTALMAADPQRIVWTKPPHCKWNGEMRFNGKTVELTDGVDIRAALLDNGEPWGIHMMGEQLQIVLLEEVEVSQVQSIKRAAIQQITLLQSVEHPVIVNAERRAADGVLEGRHVLHSPRLTLLPSGGGKLIGAGPGWYRAWMYAPKQGLLSRSDASDEDSQPQLTGVHLTYHEALEGDLTNKTLSFLKGIRVGIQPIETWKTVFDAKTMDELSTGESTLDCDRLSLAIAPGYADGARAIPGLPTPWEMEAVSGVVFRTRSENGLLEATAARAAYASGKDLFTIEGAPNRGAIIQQTKATGQPGPRLTAKELTIKPKTFEIIGSKIQSFNLGTLPATTDMKR